MWGAGEPIQIGGDLLHLPGWDGGKGDLIFQLHQHFAQLAPCGLLRVLSRLVKAGDGVDGHVVISSPLQMGSQPVCRPQTVPPVLSGDVLQAGVGPLIPLKEGEEEEAEAEFFAKYALAPPPLIHNMVENINPFSIMKKFDISYAAALYAYKYYKSWLQYGQTEYTGYERKMLSQFSIA